MNLQSALHIARDFAKAIQPFCQTGRLHLAGSARRKKPEVKDIEIVCLPLIIEHTETNLFGESKIENIIHPGFVQAIKSMGEIFQGKPDGRHMKIQLPDIKVDMFMPDADDYFRQYCIRTGSADFVHQKIACAWRRKGWCGVTGLGLRLMKNCRMQKTKTSGSTFWVCVNDKAEKPPAWKSEEAFFTWLGMDWIPPQHRNL